MTHIRNTIVGIVLVSSIRIDASPFELIAGYQPGTQVTDQNALDLDQDALRIELQYSRASQFKTAEAYYTQGAFSGSYATLRLKDDRGAASYISAGTQVQGTSESGQQIMGSVMDHIEVGETYIRVRYATSDVQAESSSCQVGALVLSGFEKLVGCFEAEGTVVIDQKGSYDYTYDVKSDNKNDRTLQKLSSNAEDEMLLCPTCPHRTFEKFFAYYDVPNYADRWVMSVFENTHTRLARGNADFSVYGGSGHKFAILVGTVVLHVWMYVIHKMEEALDVCSSTTNTDSQQILSRVKSWDEAVAFYTGSMEGQNGTDTGQMIHALADKECFNFRTCGENRDQILGRAGATLSIFYHFDVGKISLEEIDCHTAQLSKNAIEDLMVVPLVQATLRHAFVRERVQDTEETQAEGASFAASVLPLLHFCSPEDAEIIYNNMKVGSSTPAFVAVKAAFERNYQCLGISCSDVGGLYNGTNSEYYKDAEPCSSNQQQQQQSNGTAIGLGVFFGLLILLFVAIFGVWFVRRTKRQEADTFESENLHPGRAWT